MITIMFSLIAVEVSQFKSTGQKSEYLRICRILETKFDKQSRLEDQMKRNKWFRESDAPGQTKTRLDDLREQSRFLGKFEKRLTQKAERSQKSRSLESLSQRSQRLEDMRVRNTIQKEISVGRTSK